jgi:PPM family protein phosphatase
MSTKNALLPQAAAHTSTGRVRNHNEDAFGYRPEHGIFVVCDGMGGAAGGEVASRLAVDTILGRFSSEPQDGAAAREVLQQAIAEANRAVLERAQNDPGLYGMGTTLVALLLLPQGALIAHAGDSRCYLFRAGRLSLCTRDHSLVDEQLRLGTMTQEEADRSPFRSVITRAIGTQQSVTPELQELLVEAGDRFLLCSDGLTREVTEEQIAAVLAAEPSLEDSARQLVDAATEAGGRDNITCLLVQAP